MIFQSLAENIVLKSQRIMALYEVMITKNTYGCSKTNTILYQNAVLKCNKDYIIKLTKTRRIKQNSGHCT